MPLPHDRHSILDWITVSLAGTLALAVLIVGSGLFLAIRAHRRAVREPTGTRS